MKLGDVVSAFEPLQRLSNQGMKLQYAYRFHKMMECLKSEVEFFQKKRQAIFETYGIHTKEDLIEIPKENQEVASKELKELLEVEVRKNFQKLEIPISEDIQMTANDVLLLQSFVEFKEEGV